MTRSLLTLLFLILFSSTSLAGDWRVIPIRLFLGPQVKNDSVRLINSAPEPLNLQMKATVWTQNAQGEDLYEETGDIIFFPRVLSIPAGEERLLRIGYKFPAVTAEKTYRLFIEEIPNAAPGQASAVMVAVRFGLPIFIAPAQPLETAVIEQISLSKGVFSGQVKNTGNTHLLPNRVTVSGRNTAGETVFSHDLRAWYLLNGRQRNFTQTLVPAECQSATSLLFEFLSGPLQLRQEMPISKPDCRP